MPGFVIFLGAALCRVFFLKVGVGPNQLTLSKERTHEHAESDRGARGIRKSWEDAAQVAVANASKTVRNIHSIYIKNAEATVENGKIGKYRINAKISFVLGD